jgi:hypothetical protein
MPSRCGAPLPHTLWTGPMRGKSPTEEMGQPQSIMALGEHTWSPIPQQSINKALPTIASSSGMRWARAAMIELVIFL